MKNIILFIFSFAIFGKTTAQEKLVYPDTRKSDVIDVYHGVEVADPYRWMEEFESDEITSWVEDQNELTESYLSQIPFRDDIREDLTRLWDYPRYSTPFKAGEHLLYYYNDGLQPQSVLYIIRDGSTEPEVFINPNEFSDDGTVSLAGVYPSNDGSYVAYAISESGSDWREFFVIETASGNKLSDHLKFIKFSGANWFKDGFYYSRYNVTDEENLFTVSNEGAKIYYHKIGTKQGDDILIYENPENPKSSHWIFASEDEEYLYLGKSTMGVRGNELYFKDLTNNDTDWRPIFTGFGNSYSVVDKIGNDILVRTNEDAPNNKVIKLNPTFERKFITDIIPESIHVLKSVSSAGGKIFVTYSEDVSDVVYVLDMNGNKVQTLDLPDLGSVWGFSGKSYHTEVYYVFSSYVYPTTIYKYDIVSGISSLYIENEADINPTLYETKRVFYPSKDGTKIPMFLTYKKGIKLDGSNPVLLFGYGGFNVSMRPSFSVTNRVFWDNGGIYAVANIRGGGEYGRTWHEQGIKLNKQNVFDDFIAAAEFLIEEKYTNPEKLAIRGGSNGGLLVGAVINQRPDLFKVAIPQVGVMDMLRYHKFTIGWGWVTDYGSSDDPDMFEYLYKYSPLHNIKPNTKYPAVLVTTSEYDDRVVPAHSFKYAATLQEILDEDNLALIRIESKAGHGSGKPTMKMIDEQTDIWSFVMYNLGMKYERVK